MKKLRMTVLAVVFMISGFVLGACADTVIAGQMQNFTVKEYGYAGNNFRTGILVDNKTGVNYVILSGKHIYSGISITPRLNADGTLYVSK